MYFNVSPQFLCGTHYPKNNFVTNKGDSNEKSATELKTIPYAAVGTSSHQRE
jgi:hypothetical protein